MNIGSKLAYTIGEVGELLGLSRAHIYRLIDQGVLASIQIGRSRRVTANQLEAFITELEHSASGGSCQNDFGFGNRR